MAFKEEWSPDEAPTSVPSRLYTANWSFRPGVNSSKSIITESWGSSASCTAPIKESERPVRLRSTAFRRTCHSCQSDPPAKVNAHRSSMERTLTVTCRTRDFIRIPLHRAQRNWQDGNRVREDFPLPFVEWRCVFSGEDSICGPRLRWNGDPR